MAPTKTRDPWDDGDDRRADVRRSIEVDARLETADGERDGQVVNISFGGAKFVTRTVDPVLAVGTRVTLVVMADARQDLSESRWTGEIVRGERSGDDGPPRIAYAIAFESP